MKINVRDMVRRSVLYEMSNPVRWRARLRRWERGGRHGPPPHLAKLAVVVDYAQRFGLRTFVETGTNLGYMVDSVKDVFVRVISIEIDPVLFARATRKFARYPQISLRQGDSSELLPQVVAGLTDPCLFWLDAHDAGTHLHAKYEPPILEELDVVLTHPVVGHAVLIDDACRFTGAHDYPSVDGVRAFAEARGPWRVEMRDDIIRIVRMG